MPWPLQYLSSGSAKFSDKNRGDSGQHNIRAKLSGLGLGSLEALDPPQKSECIFQD